MVRYAETAFARIFATYPQCEQSVQDALRAISTPLIRSLGSRHVKLLESLRNFPPEAEAFALHVLNVFTDTARPSPALATVIKELAEERELSPQFLIPIASQMDRVSCDAMKGNQHKMESLRCRSRRSCIAFFRKSSVYSPILQRRSAKPSGPFSETSSRSRTSAHRPICPGANQKSSPPRTYWSSCTRMRRLSVYPPPKKVNRRMTRDNRMRRLSRISDVPTAIDICFTLTDRFPSEIMAVVMQRIIDSVNLPILFMRTVSRSASWV